MSGMLRLALLAVWFHRRRNLLVAAALAVVLALPVGLELAFGRGSELLLGRAHATALLLVPPGSAVDHVLSALYFEPTTVRVSQAEVERLAGTGLAELVPIYVRFSARGAPVVGTSVDYFDRRALSLAEGRRFGRLGEAVLGHQVAQRLGVGPGNVLLTDLESPFDLTGSLPLELQVSGVLAPTGGPDDLAVFVDVKTSWVVQGLGHGHGETDPSNPVPNTHRRVSEANAQSFHFHGDRGRYPLTAALVWPKDDKSKALLRARYDERDAGAVHLIEPQAVMSRVLEKAIRIRQLVLWATALVAGASVSLLVLVVSLSLSLRRRELETLARLGVSRLRINTLLASELALIVTPALLGATLAGAALALSAESLWRLFLRL